MGNIPRNKFCVIDIIQITKSGLSSAKILKFLTPYMRDTSRLKIDKNSIEISIVFILFFD